MLINNKLIDDEVLHNNKCYVLELDPLLIAFL